MIASDDRKAANMPAANDNKDQAGGQYKACVICGKPVVPAHDPFCSTRCLDVDLNRWLGGVYAVPATDDPDEDESSSPDQ
ncbi:DNA gyrase inhibitor YacG [Lichenihabitans sp. PAMC28606]|uniref:DNA gyrase inhibitor YacG n=1 Tax=Lichenihabitans sp. PAMC28606 TaxID=2880932 RepID=UPI0039B378E2